MPKRWYSVQEVARLHRELAATLSTNALRVKPPGNHSTDFHKGFGAGIVAVAAILEKGAEQMLLAADSEQKHPRHGKPHTREDHFVVECPYCHAQPGEQCINRHGHRCETGYHRARCDASKRFLGQ